MTKLPYGWSIYQIMNTTMKNRNSDAYDQMVREQKTVLEREIPDFLKIDKGTLFYVKEGSFCLITMETIKNNPSKYLHKIKDKESNGSKILFGVRNQSPKIDEPNIFPIFCSKKNIIVAPISNDKINELIEDAVQRQKLGKFKFKLTKALCYLYGNYKNARLPRIVSSTEVIITNSWCEKKNIKFFEKDFEEFDNLINKESHSIGSDETVNIIKKTNSNHETESNH